MKRFFLLTAIAGAFAAASTAADVTSGKGMPKFESVGPLAFGPDGMLFVADAKAKAVVAIATGDTTKGKIPHFKIDGLDAKIAALLGTKSDGIVIRDMKVNPASGSVYLSVMRGTSPILIKVAVDGTISEFAATDAPFSRVSLKNVKDGNARAEAITGIVFQKGKLYVAALPSEEFASNLRTYSFPFEAGDDGITTEIFHGAHGKYETASPVQSFMAMEIDGKTHILAGYTCTPLVTFPVSDLKGNKKLRGTTVAELGNRNKPLDMFAYSKDGQEYLLVANTARGVMKVSTAGIGKEHNITTPVKDTAGLKYETVKELKDVMQLDKIDDDHGVIVAKSDKGLTLKTIHLP